MLVSIVAPFYNEEALVNEFVNRVNAVVNDIAYPVEIITVDDGSSDNTLALLVSGREKSKNIKIVSLSRNYGLQPALQPRGRLLGFRHDLGAQFGHFLRECRVFQRRAQGDQTAMLQ